MSDIRVKDLSARAALRLGRTYQVNALAPFPARPPLNLWQPWRRAWMHPAADLGAGFGFGADSNLLRRLKNGIAAEGLDPAGLDTLTNADVTTDRRGVAVRPAAAARLAAATREAITKAERPPKLQNWFFEKRPAQRIARQLASAETGEYEDAGGGEAIDIAIHLPEGAAARSSRSKYIAAPIRLTHVHVAFGFDQTMPGLLRWSVSPPGIGYTIVQGIAPSNILSPHSVSGPLDLELDVPVLFGGVQLELELQRIETTFSSNTAYLAVAYTPLRRVLT